MGVAKGGRKLRNEIIDPLSKNCNEHVKLFTAVGDSHSTTNFSRESCMSRRPSCTSGYRLKRFMRYWASCKLNLNTVARYSSDET